MITVTSKWLLQHLKDPDLVIIDGRGNMPYRLGHIKNARYLGIEKVISLADNGANLVLDKSLAEELFSNLGIDDSKMVVVYGEYMDPSSSRIAWTLMYHGGKEPDYQFHAMLHLIFLLLSNSNPNQIPQLGQIQI